MFELYEIISIFLLYMLILFVLAFYIEKSAHKFKSNMYKYIYSLAFAIYCTAWTYYGSVGKVSSGGILFLAVYLGPTLMIFLWPIILKRLIKIKEQYKITSVSDLISARYDKSILIGSFVSFGILAGIIPYISIQLKAIIQSIDILLVDDINSNLQSSSDIDEVGLLIVVLMAFFTIIFGLRKLDPSERHFAMVFIVAFESIIKLIALLIIGIFVSYFVFDDISSILNEVSKNELFKNVAQGENSVDYSTWLSVFILSMFAVMFLPRQFHISVVENSNINHIKTVMWLFPLYLFLITLFTIPIALGGSLLDINHTLNDFYVLTIPMSLDKPLLSLISFIGGFSASTSMIMITSMAMSIIVSNYFVVPLIESSSKLNFLKKRILIIRWIIVTLLIFLSYIFYLYVSKSNLIVNVGLISFTAILQLAPVIIAGLFWEKANKYGAFAALISGFFIWFYTLIIPQFVNSNWISSFIIEQGAFGISFLNPTALFGLNSFDSIPHAVFWSMLFNISFLIIFSLLTKTSRSEKQIAHDFVNILKREKAINLSENLENSIDSNKKLNIIRRVLIQYIPAKKVKISMKEINTKFALEKKEKINILELSKIYAHIESLLAGFLGNAVAHNVLQKYELFSENEDKELSNINTKLLKNIKISPIELSKKIDYFKEKEKLLNEHYVQLEDKINQRDKEIEARKLAQEEIKNLNETLEQKVTSRTKQLKEANSELEKSMNELKMTQDSLIESEKMAGLGELVAGVAHEINTPVGISLTGITHFLTSSKKIAKLYETDELSEEDFQEFINTANELAEIININLNKTANLVRSFKQVAVDQSSNDKREFELCEYLDEILLSLNNITKKTNIDIKIECKDKIYINSFPGAISQIITNLIINTTLHAYEEKEHGKIEIKAKQLDENVCIIYKDFGKGIPKENKQKVFNPFFTTNREKGGSGLGLSIIYNLISSKLNGTITLKSKKDKGTTFFIEFPLKS